MNNIISKVRGIKSRRWGLSPILFIILIIITSYSLFFYLQFMIEKDTKHRLFYQQIEHQLESTKDISRHIGSDLDAVMLGLHGLAESVYLQQGDLLEDKAKKQVQETYSRLNNITIVEGLFVLDKNSNIAVESPVIRPNDKGSLSYLELKVGNLEGLINETRARLVAVVSNGFKDKNNNYEVALSYPVLSRETKGYIGTIMAVIPTVKFFEHYGNIHNIDKQYLVAYDKSGAYLASPAAINSSPSNGEKKSSFANEIQQFIKYNKNLNDKVVLSGQPGDKSTNEFGLGERLSTGYPILVQGKRAYSIFVVTPTSVIYSQVNEVLFLERLEMFLLLSGTTVSVAILIIVLYRWNNSLEREVKRRTKELAELNNQLRVSNDQLKVHDNMQREFINVAAHELRTPLQPILSYNALASKGMIDKDESIRVIGKQARRLQKLANDLLAINRIESGNLSCRMEKIRINDLILEVVNNYSLSKQKIGMTNKSNNKEGENDNEVTIKTELDYDIEEVDADKDRLVQVLTNIMDNALKFTKKGTVKIESRLLQSENQVEVKISDTGTGIPKDILYTLFDKFVTKNISRKEKEHGTGLGLYISNAIVTAHGGRITAYNNSEGGATFTVILPIDHSP